MNARTLTKSIFSICCLALASYQVSAFAKDEPKPRVKPIFEQFDLNADNYFSRDECVLNRLVAFHKTDADRNGTVTLEEYQARSKKIFKDYDHDGNGSVNMSEFVEFWVSAKGQAGKEVKTLAKQATGVRNMKSIFDQVDLNGDGKISPAEGVASRRARFKLMDVNANGSLDMDEVISGRYQLFKLMDTAGNNTLISADFAMTCGRVD
jgi:Ca2+-binding EF-hand superfamily protein